MYAAGKDRKSQDRKSHDRMLHDRKSHDLQHDTDVASDTEAGSNNDNDMTVSFSLALIVGCILLLLNIIVFAGTMCQWPRLRRRRRRRRKQRHAAALAALTSHPVDNRKSDGDAISSPRAGEVTEETRLTLLCPDDHVRACNDALSECHCTRPDRDLSYFCDGDCSSNVNVKIGTSLETVRSTTNNVTECNHVFSRNQFTVV